MSDGKITVNDVIAYESLFKFAPAFLLERFAKRNTNVVSKFQSKIESHLAKISDNQKNKLKILLETDIDEIQRLLGEAHEERGLKQYKVLANPEYKQFIEDNLSEIRKLVTF